MRRRQRRLINVHVTRTDREIPAMMMVKLQRAATEAGWDKLRWTQFKQHATRTARDEEYRARVAECFNLIGGTED